MIEWRASFTEEWTWSSPTNVLGVASILVTALIPFFLWRLGTKQAKRDGDLRAQQVSILRRQERILQRQRRDALLSIVDDSSDAMHLELLWEEVAEYAGRDRVLLQATFRANVAVALPGDHLGIRVADQLDSVAVTQYVAGLERRYGPAQGGVRGFDGLFAFLEQARARQLAVDTTAIVKLVTGKAAEIQRPGHGFYRELVNLMPEAAGSLLHRVEDIDYRTAGGTRLNVLTGVLLGIKDAELNRAPDGRPPLATAVSTLRHGVPSALAQLLHRDNLRSLDRWSLEGSTEPVSATIAWLIRAVGWLADGDSHLARRMVENLAPAIRSIPEGERGWGIDDRDVRQGFAWIREKQPRLWGEYSEELISAASSVGEWNEAQGQSRSLPPRS
ncbi:hypothetical protein QFZ53_002794 [Microbacterium natoriense]|uniref:Uncharacterized protein n=1 Tax=Microbacterium natoriense TaxID=284570 RepID=A0AAW8EYK1_9MICO|nr:hypothetical protein [Microbacterium natoriense]MDQ0648598.1 hypothetical protein [Microbacterium natoriense]